MRASDLELVPRPDQWDARARSELAGRSTVSRIAAIAVLAYLLATGILLGAGWLVTEFGVPGWLGDVDQGVTHWLAANRSGPLNTITANLSKLAHTFTVVGTAVGAGAVLLVVRRWRQVVVLLVALPLELAVFLSVGYLVGRPRPEVAALDAIPATASFPSGHVAAAIALYGGLALVLRSMSISERVNQWVLVAVFVIVVGVGFSRVYRGLHHPSDILAGAALGLAAVAAAVVAARSVDEVSP